MGISRLLGLCGEVAELDANEVPKSCRESVLQPKDVCIGSMVSVPQSGRGANWRNETPRRRIALYIMTQTDQRPVTLRFRY
jgi:hypothetical protein